MRIIGLGIRRVEVQQPVFSSIILSHSSLAVAAASTSRPTRGGATVGEEQVTGDGGEGEVQVRGEGGLGKAEGDRGSEGEGQVKREGGEEGERGAGGEREVKRKGGEEGEGQVTGI